MYKWYSDFHARVSKKLYSIFDLILHSSYHNTQINLVLWHFVVWFQRDPYFYFYLNYCQSTRKMFFILFAPIPKQFKTQPLKYIPAFHVWHYNIIEIYLIHLYSSHCQGTKATKPQTTLRFLMFNSHFKRYLQKIIK